MSLKERTRTIVRSITTKTRQRTEGVYNTYDGSRFLESTSMGRISQAINPHQRVGEAVITEERPRFNLEAPWKMTHVSGAEGAVLKDD